MNFKILIRLNKSLAHNILLTKTTAAQNEDALSYYTVRGLYLLAVVFVRSIYALCGIPIYSYCWLSTIIIEGCVRKATDAT